MPTSPCIWNPADKGSVIVLDPDGVNMTKTSGGGFVRSTSFVTTGKWYLEMERISSTLWMLGLSNATAVNNTYPGGGSGSFGIENGTVYGASETGATGTLAVTGWIGMAVDADARTCIFSHPSGTLTCTIPWAGAIYLAAGGDSGITTGGIELNAGASAFAYSVPSGYSPGFPGVFDGVLSGVVDDAPNQRTVHALRRGSFSLVGTALSDASTGEFSIDTPYDEDHTVVALHDSLNALVFDRVTPV